MDDPGRFAVSIESGPVQPNSAKQHPVPMLFSSGASAAGQKESLEPLESRDLPKSLDDVLVKRNAELLRGIAQQQDRFLLTIRSVMLQEGPKLQLHRPNVMKATETSLNSTLGEIGAKAAQQDFETEGLPLAPRKDAKKTTKTSLSSAQDKEHAIADLRNLKTFTEAMQERGIGGSENSGGGQKTARRPSKISEDLRCMKTFTEVMEERGIHESEGSAIQVLESRQKRPSQMTDDHEGYSDALKVSQQKRESVGKTAEPQEVKQYRWRQQMQKLVASVSFQTVFTGAIITNSLLIGVQTQYTAANLGEDTPRIFFVLSSAYSFLFLVELTCQLLAYGPRMFWSEGWYWSWLDLFIVVTSIVDFISDIFLIDSTTASTGQVRVIRVLRVARLARVVRIMRVVKALRALRTLVYSIMCTLKSLMWALVLVGLIIYIFGILFTDTVSSHLLDNPAPWDEGSLEFTLDEYFGSLQKSMNCLFRSVAGGVDWHYAAEALAQISWVWTYAFTIYISFTCFAVLNVMTGVFCQSAVESAQRDQEMAVQNVMLNKQRFEDMLMGLFQQIDEDGSGRITIAEFENHFQDEAFRLLLHSLELEVQDAWSLFMMLDQDGDHDIDAEEFLDGCMHLKGNAKAIEVAKLKRKTENSFTQLKTKLASMEEQQHEATKVLLQIAGMFSETKAEGLEFQL